MFVLCIATMRASHRVLSCVTRSIAALAMLLLAGCTSGGHKSRPDPQPSLRSSGATITIQTNQHTVTMRAGQSQDMYLAASGYFTSDAIDLSTPGIVKLSNVRGGYPAKGYSATVTALHAGTVELKTESDIFCLHSKPDCVPPQRVYDVTVVVSSLP